MNIVTIIVTFNNAKTISEVLTSLQKQTVKSSLIVVDNGSTDGTQKTIENFKEVLLIQNSENAGYAGGNNRGIEAALKQNPHYVLIHNPDAFLTRTGLEEMLKQAQVFKDTAIVGPCIFLDRGQKTIWSKGGVLDNDRYTAKLVGYENQTEDTPKALDFVSGTCLLLPSGILQKKMRFYEPYFMYYEDVEFCVAARKNGYNLTIAQEAHLIHLERSNGGVYSEAKKYYLARNHLLFVERNAPKRVQLHETIRLPKTIWEHQKKHDVQSLRGVGDYLLRRFGKQQ